MWREEGINGGEGRESDPAHRSNEQALQKATHAAQVDKHIFDAPLLVGEHIQHIPVEIALGVARHWICAEKRNHLLLGRQKMPFQQAATTDFRTVARVYQVDVDRRGARQTLWKASRKEWEVVV